VALSDSGDSGQEDVFLDFLGGIRICVDVFNCIVFDYVHDLIQVSLPSDVWKKE